MKKTKKKRKQRIEKLKMSGMIILCLFILVLFLLQSVPLCFQGEEEPEEPTQGDVNATYTSIELVETKIELEKLDFLIFKARGHSMLPLIQNNSDCVCFEKENYEVGDIVVFFMKTSNTTYQGIGHKIIKIEGESITTKGTNNPYVDSAITKENILCFIPQQSRYKLLIQSIKETICQC